jgi:predicted RNA-binding protein with TRAM domain
MAIRKDRGEERTVSVTEATAAGEGTRRMTKTLGQMADEGAAVILLFERVATLCEQRGWTPIGFRAIELPGGFVVTVNGTKEPQPDAIGFEIPPFHASVIVRDWPGGVFSPFGGTLVGGIEDRLIAAVEQAITEVTRG